MPVPVSPIRAEVEAALTAEMSRVGPEALDKGAIVARFGERGVARATLYRWVAEILRSGRPAAQVTAAIDAAVAERASASPTPSRDAAREMVAALPPVPVLRDVESAGGPIAVQSLLSEVIANQQRLQTHACAEDGKIRNARLFAVATEGIRRSIETALKMQQSLYEARHIDAFHAAIIEEIGQEAPVVAERIKLRLDQFLARWASGAT